MIVDWSFVGEIDPDCGAPEEPHTPFCDGRMHMQLIFAVMDSVEPPVFRAARGDHSLCPVDPCPDCA